MNIKDRDMESCINRRKVRKKQRNGGQQTEEKRKRDRERREARSRVTKKKKDRITDLNYVVLDYKMFSLTVLICGQIT